MTIIRVNSDIEDPLHRAFKMSSIAVTLAERAFKHTAESFQQTAAVQARREALHVVGDGRVS